jgi:GntR family transcriptional regulator, rspAB operon transcriptional repressor
VSHPAVAVAGPVTPLILETRPDSLTDAVYEAIRTGIVENRLPPGYPLTEAALAEQLGVSKTPVREALLRLKAAGVIEPNGRRGGRVVRRSEQAIRRAYEVRDALEPYAAARAAERATNGELVDLQSLAERSLSCAERGDMFGFSRHDSEFHSSVAMASGNPLLRRMIEDALTLAMTLRRRDRPRATASTACGQAHVRIARAIAECDAAAAEHEMRRHIGFVSALVLALPQGGPTADGSANLS